MKYEQQGTKNGVEWKVLILEKPQQCTDKFFCFGNMIDARVEQNSVTRFVNGWRTFRKLIPHLTKFVLRGGLYTSCMKSIVVKLWQLKMTSPVPISHVPVWNGPSLSRLWRWCAKTF